MDELEVKLSENDELVVEVPKVENIDIDFTVDEIEVEISKEDAMDVNLEKEVRVVMPKYHNEILGLDYKDSGHTGFASTEELNTVKKTPAKPNSLGMVKVGENLNVTEYGTLSVDITDKAEDGNNKPVTSHAVHTIVGNIDKLLEII